MLARGLLTASADHLYAFDAFSGVESRHPALDRRVVDFCLSIPLEQYLLKGQTRSLIRRAMSGVLPEPVRMNQRAVIQGASWHLHFDQEKPDIQAETRKLNHSETARRVLNCSMLETLASEWPRDWSDPGTVATYRLRFLRGLAVGRFLRWFEGEKLDPDPPRRT